MRALPALLLTACSGGEGRDAQGAEGETTVVSSAQRGPVSLTVRADPDEITVGERLRLTLEVTAAEGVEVVMPRLEGAVGPFKIRSAHTPPDVPEGGRRLFRHTYELDTFASGEVEIPAFTVEFTQRDPPGEPVEAELTSDPLRVKVLSVLAAGEGESELRDIKGAVDVPGGWQRAWIWVAAAIGLVAAGLAAAVLLLRRRREKAVGERRVPPHEWALRELGRLEAERLIEAERFHAFYFRLSDIVRQYIERRFSIMAPERTTEEFLHEARRSALLAEEHKDLLARFLRAADLVKFARHEPSVDESREALAAARRFVEETVPAPAREAREEAG